MISDYEANDNIHTQTSMMKNQQYALCDCARPGNGKLNFKTHEYFENRYVRRNSRYGTIDLVFLLNFENLIQVEQGFPPYSGFFHPWPKCCEAGGKCGRRIDKADPACTNAFKGDTFKALWEILPKFPSQNLHVFANLGWEHLHNMEMQSDFSCFLQEAFDNKYHPHIKPYLMSHPPTLQNVQDPTKQFDASKLQCNIEVFDRTTVNTNISSDWYIDGVHVNSILNREYNQQLMRTLCPEMLSFAG